jgi:putative acetyltransferase
LLAVRAAAANRARWELSFPQESRMRIRREESRDIPQVRAVNIAAFGSAAEADIVDVVRSDAHEVVSLVAEEGGEIVGHIMFSPVRVVGGSDLRAMALAPMAVSPQRQRIGVGGELVRAGLEECRRGGAVAVFVVGHPSYYPRFGFSPASALGFKCELDVDDEAFMAAELIPGALAGGSGTVHFHEAFRNV